MTEKVADSSVLYDSSPRTHNQSASPSEAATRLAGMLARGHTGGTKLYGRKPERLGGGRLRAGADRTPGACTWTAGRPVHSPELGRRFRDRRGSRPSSVTMSVTC